MVQSNASNLPGVPAPSVIGNGMVARAFSAGMLSFPHAIVFASGVSNSNCADTTQFERERAKLAISLAESSRARPFLYFGTCSVYDPDAQASPYLAHKLEMEALALSHPRGHVIRLPQLAGPNAPPETLVSALVSKIRQGSEIRIWANAMRNIIDVEDAVKIVDAWLVIGQTDARILNVANTLTVPVMHVVRAIESALNLVARVALIPKGAPYEINTEAMRAAANSAGVRFGPDYLEQTIRKYYR
jgi:nucleoside-diphosphate-sugar epimerase